LALASCSAFSIFDVGLCNGAPLPREAHEEAVDSQNDVDQIKYPKPNWIYFSSRDESERSHRTVEEPAMGSDKKENAHASIKPSRELTLISDHAGLLPCRTSKMSHDHGRRAACGMTIRILQFHFDRS
jgi:hypothetical protein